MSSALEAHLLKVVSVLQKKKLRVGIPSDAKQPESKGKTAPPLWLIGYINEFGDEGMHIPPRPFLVPGVQDVRDKIVAQLRKGAQAAFEGDYSAPEAALHAAGLIAQASVKARLINGPFVPLKPTTIAARARRRDEDGKLVNIVSTRNARNYRKLQKEGVPTDVLQDAGLAKPLIDTGALYGAINYAIKG